MTASNDLHYNIIPSKLCGPAERRYNTAASTYLPEQDYLKSYGNLTHFGLADWYHCMRRTENCRRMYSLMKESYRCPKYSALLNHNQRRATPRKFSSHTKSNLINENLNLRNKTLILPPEYLKMKIN